MNKNDQAFWDSCKVFKGYASIDEYKADIKRWLTLSSWHYSEEGADERIKAEEAYIQRAFDNREPVDDCGAEVGFCCG